MLAYQTGALPKSDAYCETVASGRLMTTSLTTSTFMR
jgi:hypothetical protein